MISTSLPSVSTLAPSSTSLLEITSFISDSEELDVLRAFHVKVSVHYLCNTRLGLQLASASFTSRKFMGNDRSNCWGKPLIKYILWDRLFCHCKALGLVILMVGWGKGFIPRKIAFSRKPEWGPSPERLSRYTAAVGCVLSTASYLSHILERRTYGQE